MIKQALILAGGEGTRLAPLGEYLPKCLATVYNRPLIDYQLRLLQSAGVTEVAVAIGVQYDAVLRESVRLLERTVEVQLVVEPEPLGVAALFEASARLRPEPFWVLLGDIHFEAERLPQLDLPDGRDALLLTREFSDPERLAALTANVVVDQERVLAVRDKPTPAAIKGDLGWAGLAIIGPTFLERRSAILKWLEKKPAPRFGDLFEAALWLGGSMTARPAPAGGWFNINTPEQLLEAARCEARKHVRGETGAGPGATRR
ncbi:MAG: NTP transferase domain-containing protein [Deltaproteobacteria bacterium]|nr:NTP transferase domain-containing protein [Deltaproteobacteria bacterium]